MHSHYCVVTFSVRFSLVDPLMDLKGTDFSNVFKMRLPYPSYFVAKVIDVVLTLMKQKTYV